MVQLLYNSDARLDHLTDTTARLIRSKSAIIIQNPIIAERILTFKKEFNAKGFDSMEVCND